MVGKVVNVDYKVEMASGKVKTFYINMLKKYYQPEATDDKKQSKSTRMQHEAAAIACVRNTSSSRLSYSSKVRPNMMTSSR